MPPRPYHHGDLRRSLLDAALEKLAHRPASALSLRALARQVGVSHAAPAHHFGDRSGLLEALAREGFEALHAVLDAARENDRSFLDIGVAYVDWAVQNPVHYRLMFGPDAVDPAHLEDVRAGTRHLLHGAATELSDDRDSALAGWAIAHGLAGLLIDGQIEDPRTDPQAVQELARSVLGRLGPTAPDH